MSLKASTAVTGARVVASSRRPAVAPRATVMSVVADASEERVRLHNLTPLKGSRQRKQRIGRGYGAGQGGSCGDG
jgi:large subunit ribosomal protein L15